MNEEENLSSPSASEDTSDTSLSPQEADTSGGASTEPAPKERKIVGHTAPDCYRPAIPIFSEE
jgi:hypothetical protein